MGDLLALLEDNFFIGFDDALQLNQRSPYLDLLLGKLDGVLAGTVRCRLIRRGIHFFNHPDILNYYHTDTEASLIIRRRPRIAIFC